MPSSPFRLSRPALILLVFALICALWRALWLPFSQSSYTDGLLQVDMFRFGVGYWPPLYALLARLFAWIPGLGLEGAGRLVSFLCGVGVTVPLGVLTARLLGWRAARWAMAVWIVSPIATRWSLQVMTDMPLLLFWTAALMALVLAAEKFRPELFPAAEPPLAADPRAGASLLLLASFCGVLATLTRFQGLFLLPLILLACLRLPPAGAIPPARRWLALAPWLAFPAWLLRGGAAPLLNHFQQIGERAQSASALQTFLNIYWFQFEDFILYSPYFITWGLFGFFLYGLFRTNWSTPRLRWVGFAGLFLAFAILALQAVFSSFQSRYLLPLGPFVCLFAGHGFATWERHTAACPRRFWLLAGPSLLLALLVSAAVATFQGSPFLDIKQAARAIAEQQPAETARIYSNEVYNAKIGAAKLAFWLDQREILPIPLTQTRSGELMLMVDQMVPNTGDIIVVSSAYGGTENYGRIIETIRRYLHVEELGRFNHTLYPIDPDIMQEPGTHQNPLALSYRYRPQRFQTIVLRVASRPAAVDTTPPVLPAESEATTNAIQDLEDFSKSLSPAGPPAP